MRILIKKPCESFTNIYYVLAHKTSLKYPGNDIISTFVDLYKAVIQRKSKLTLSVTCSTMS